jgi:hypothetical protein
MPIVCVDADGLNPRRLLFLATQTDEGPQELPDVPAKPKVPTPDVPCQDSNGQTTEVRVCKRRIREGIAGDVRGGHLYIRVTCGPAATGEFAWSAGPLSPDEKCKDKCSGKQLRGGYGYFLPAPPKPGDVISPEYPRVGEVHTCTRYLIRKSPAEVSRCLYKLAEITRDCCVPYQGIPAVPGEGCNSNCMAYWWAKTCFQPIIRGGEIEVTPGEPLVTTPGWADKMPKCMSDALKKAGMPY